MAVARGDTCRDRLTVVDADGYTGRSRSDSGGNVERPWSHADADEVARQLAGEYRAVGDAVGDSGRAVVRRVRTGPPAWVYVTDASVIRLVVADPAERHVPSGAESRADADTPGRDSAANGIGTASLDDLLARTQRLIDLARRLRDRGAHVPEFVGFARRIGPAVATVSARLPGADATPTGLGTALASLHDAGSDATTLALAEPFDPLARPRRTLAQLTALYRDGGAFTAGQCTFPPGLLAVFRARLDEAAAAAREATELVRRRRGCTVVHADVHPGNVRTDRRGVATLIDLDDMSSGPAEYDLARPLGQWVRRFGRPASDVAALRRSYELRRGPVDSDVLRLLCTVSDVRFGTSLITHAVDAHRCGLPPDEWSLAEGVRRLRHLADPLTPWRSREDELRRRAEPRPGSS